MNALTIAHATALSAEDEPIFEHALALACASGARLYSVNAHDGLNGHEHMPYAASVLERWGRDPASVHHDTLFLRGCDDPVDSVLDGLRRVTPNLVVLGTHQRHGLAHLVEGSHSEAILRNIREPTLVFPVGVRGFVSERGDIELRRIVIPAGDDACVAAARARATWFAELAGLDDVDIVSVVAQFPAGIANAVVGAAGDLIVMATRGADSLSDILFGTNTEHVLRTTRCPLLVVPVTDSS